MQGSESLFPHVSTCAIFNIKCFTTDFKFKDFNIIIPPGDFSGHPCQNILNSLLNSGVPSQNLRFMEAQHPPNLNVKVPAYII